MKNYRLTLLTLITLLLSVSGYTQGQPHVHRNGVIQEQTAYPLTPQESWLKYDFTTNQYRYYNGTEWVTFSASGDPDQTLSLSRGTLTISGLGGNSVTLPSAIDGIGTTADGDAVDLGGVIPSGHSANINLDPDIVSAASVGTFVNIVGTNSLFQFGNLTTVLQAQDIDLITTNGGFIQFFNGTAPNVGDVWTADDTLGNGYWATPVNTSISSRVIVTDATQLSGVLDSTKEYFIDGNITTTGDIQVPQGGLNLRSLGFETGSLTLTGDNAIMFTSPVGGSGDLILKNIAINASGIGQSVFALTDATGNNAVEMARVNFNGCTSLGYLDGYRQGLEENTGRFGGTPTLEFRGTWNGGYFVQTSITRGVTDAIYNIYQSAVGQTFASRVGGNMNTFLPSNVSLFGFTEANFVSDELLQVDNANFSGTGSALNGISETSPKVRISGNTRGAPTTSVGGSSKTTTSTETTITTTNTLVRVAGTRTYNNLTWFTDGGVNDAQTYNSTQPTKMKAFYSGSFLGANNQTYDIVIRHWDDSASTYIDIAQATFTTNGGLASDRAEGVSFPTERFTMDINDRVERWIRNITETSNPRERLESILILEEAR